jgi:septum formation protein
MPVILASGSPRRIELLRRLGVEFDILPADVDEQAVEAMTSSDSAGAIALAVARAKAATVLLTNIETTIIAADTVVYAGGTSFGKPSDRSTAVSMLRSLSNRDHIVATGVVVRRGSAAWEVAVTAKVTMRGPSTAELDAYVDSGEPVDKAGAYAIQGLGANLISAVEGCYLTIVGFPLCAVATALNQLGITCVTDPCSTCASVAADVSGNPPFEMPTHPVSVDALQVLVV